jgi:hypothetical protein
MFFYLEIRDENSRLGQRCLAQDARIKQCYPTVLSGFGIAFGLLIINTFVCNEQDFWLFDDFSYIYINTWKAIITALIVWSHLCESCYGSLQNVENIQFCYG